MKWPSKLNSEAKAKWQLVSLKPGDFNYVSRLCSALGQHTDWLSPSYVHSVSELWVWTGSLFVLETPNSHRFKHISSFCFQEGFYLWLWCTFNSKMRSHEHTGNITSQVLICLFSITLFQLCEFQKILACEGSFLWGKGQPDFQQWDGTCIKSVFTLHQSSFSVLCHFMMKGQ